MSSADDAGRAVPEVGAFLRHLRARGCSPNTVAAYAYDLLHFTRFLTGHGLAYGAFTSAHALALLEHLRQLPSRRASQRLGLALWKKATLGEPPERLRVTIEDMGTVG